MNIKLRDKFLPIATAVFGEEEKKEIIETLESGWITLGPRTKKFEEMLVEYIGAKYAIALNSCSAALHLALLAAGVGKGDEVITTPFTFAATVNAILHVGATPVFVDIDPNTLSIDSKLVESKITKKTKVLLPVHYGGQPIDLDHFRSLADKYSLVLIEDAAHAIGAEYKSKKIGMVGDMVCFSFHPVKNMTTGDGGAVVTNNKDYADKLGMLRVNGMDKESWNRNTTTGTWDYAISCLGFKYHMNDIAASLGMGQLKKLDGFIEIRKELAHEYMNILGKTDLVRVLPLKTDVKHAFNLFPVLLNTSKLSISRNEVMNQLKSRNIGSVVYYRPLHMHKFYSDLLGYKQGQFKVCEDVFEKLICLPIYPAMDIEDVHYVVKVLMNILENNIKVK